MKKRCVVCFITILTVLPMIFSVFSSIEAVWAADGAQFLSMSTVEDVTILGSGDALLTLSINVADSPLADMYRELLAAPSDANVGEEMPIPENKTEDGAVTPVREEFHRSIKQEQKSSFGFETRIFNSSMVPRSEQDECRISINAVALLQVVSVTDVGSDVILEVVVGPKDENATGVAFGFVLTKVAFAQMMLESLEGEQVYELEWTTRIKVPAEAALLNGDELATLSWDVNFGGGTSMSAFVYMDGPSTVVLSERTLVTEQNITATPKEIFEAFSGYKVFTVRYQLPKSALVEGEGAWTSGLDRDWSYSWDWSLSLSLPFPFEFKIPITPDVYGEISGTLTVTPTFSFAGYIGWDFEWLPWPDLDWFEAWISVSSSIKVRLDATITIAAERTFERTLFDRTLFRFTFSIGPVPAWADLDFSIIARLTVGASAEVTFWTEAVVGGSFKAGVKYDGGWSTIQEANLYGSLDGPTVTNIEINAFAEAALMGRLSFLIYSKAGPYIEFGPYVRGDITYYVLDEFTVWTVVTGLKLNVGVTFRGYLADLLGVEDYSATLGDWPIKTWEGHWGQARSSISINLEPASINLGAGTWVSGTISTAYPGYSLRGTVRIEYSSDEGSSWTVVDVEIPSRVDGSYSYWWFPLSSGSFLVRSSWLGNEYYKAATSASVTLEVSSVVSPVDFIFYDDGLFDTGVSGSGYWQGCAVRFTAPSTLWTLDRIWVCGMYGENPGFEGSAADAAFDVEIWDSELNTLMRESYLYTSYFDRFEYDWSSIDIPDIAVSGDFYVVVIPRGLSYWDYEKEQSITEYWVSVGADIPDQPDEYDGRDYFVLRGGFGAREAYPNELSSQVGWDLMIRAEGMSTVEDHYMYAKRWVRIGKLFSLRNVETNTFYIDEDYAYSMVKFRDTYPPDWPAVTYSSVTWKWYEPDPRARWPFLTDTLYYLPQKWDGTAEATLPIAIQPAFYEPYLGRPFKVEIYWNGILAVTETFRIIKHESSISLTLSSDSITYGQSVQISSQTSPSFSNGTTTLQYSTDEINWNDIAAGTPSDGYYSQTWVPPQAGTYYIRAVWSGNLNYAANTSETLNLTVNPAPTELSTSLSSTTIIKGSTVTITATLTSAITGTPLQGKDVTIQFSSDGSTWYTLSPETTDSAGQCAYEWTPDLGIYYIRSMWYGDDDYLGSNSPSIQLTVEPSSPTIVEIVDGADAEIDRTPDATAEFAVKVKDQLTGEYLTNIGTVQFYVSDQSYFNNILVGADTDEDGDGIYRIEWNTGDWPILGPQPWSAYFEGTSEYMPSSAMSTLTIYYYGVALWIEPTFQEISITSTKTHTINLKWNRDEQDTFDLSLTGLDPTWYSLSQTSITVSSKGQTEQVTLTVSPPNAPTILKDYEFTVTATSQEDPSFSVSASATVRVDFTPTPPATPTGGLAIAVQPKTIYMSAGTKIVVNILIINNQNFDDTIKIDITNSGIPPLYQASLAWFNWTEVKVFIPAKSRIYIPLEITVPEGIPNGFYIFRAIATSTANLAITAKDSGIIRLQ